LGSARLYNPVNGDIRIGRGTAAGDGSVIITTNVGNKGTYIFGAPTSVPVLTVGAIPGGTDIRPDIPTVSMGDAGNVFFGDYSAFSRLITYLPLPPVYFWHNGVKYFAKQKKTWKGDVVAMDIVTSATDYTYDNTAKTLTKKAYGPPVFDGDTLAGNARVLINCTGFAGNGLYKVTVVGTVSPPLVYTVLTKTTDGGGPGSVEFLGQGFDIFDGVAVAITGGDTWAGYYAVLDAPQVAEEVDLSVYSWNSTDTINADEFCVMWADGSYTVLATGPEYLPPVS
jgi:hypothetical protein